MHTRPPLVYKPCVMHIGNIIQRRPCDTAHQRLVHLMSLSHIMCTYYQHVYIRVVNLYMRDEQLWHKYGVLYR